MKVYYSIQGGSFRQPRHLALSSLRNFNRYVDKEIDICCRLLLI